MNDVRENIDMKLEHLLSPKVFSKIARPYEWLTTHGLQEEAISALSQALPKEGWILDVACGPGIILSRVLAAEPRRSGVGLDAAGGPVLRAQSRVPVVLANAEKMPFPDGAFVASYISGALYLMNDPERVLLEMKRVSREEVMVLEASPQARARAALDHKKALKPKERLDQLMWSVAMRVTRRYDEQSLSAALAAAGLESVGVEQVARDLYLLGRGKVPKA